MRFSRLLNPNPGEPGSSAAGDQTKPAGDPAAPAKKSEVKPEAAAPEKETDPRVAEARTEAIQERKKRQALEEKIKTLETKGLEDMKKIRVALGMEGSDDDPAKAAESARAERAAMETKYKSSIIRSAVVSLAQKKGAIDPEAVFHLGDFSKVLVNLGGERAEGVEEIVDQVLKDRAYLLGTKPSLPAGGSPPASDPTPGKLAVDDIKALMAKARLGDEQAQLAVAKRSKEIGALQKSGAL